MNETTETYVVPILGSYGISYEQRCHGIDVSPYQDNTIPWKYFRDNGMKKTVVKGGQGLNTEAHVKLSRLARFDVQEYYWHYPNVSIKYQVDMIKRDFNLHKPSRVWLDVVQWWSNWTEYWEYLAGERPKENIDVINHKLIASSAYAILNILKASLEVPVGIRTSWLFQEEYSPEIAQWISEFDLWVISSSDYGKTKYKVTMDQFMSSPTGSPLLPHGAITWKAWQFSREMVLPGYHSSLNCDVWKE